MNDDACTCPFPRDNCPACEHVCRACRLGLREENARLRRERDEAVEDNDRLRREREERAEVYEQTLVHMAESHSERVAERDQARGQVAIAREELEAIGRKAAVQCVVCNRLASFCDSEPVREKFQCTGRMARRALARLDAASPAEPKYPCGCCGALRMKGQGVTTFTVCDHCYDNCMHGRPHVPESPAEKPAQIPVASPSGRASETLAPPGGGETGGIYMPAEPPVVKKRAVECRCRWEEGDPECPVHAPAGPPVALRPARAVEILDSLAAELEQTRLYEIPGGQKVSRTPRWCGLCPGKRQLLTRFIADMREALTSQPGGGK